MPPDHSGNDDDTNADGGRRNLIDASSTVVANRATPPSRNDNAIIADADLPVVARLVIEIHSDGTRTIARGAMQTTDDSPAGMSSVAIDARGDSPLSLALQLTKSLATSLSPLAVAKAIAANRPNAKPRPSLRAKVRRLLARR